MDVKDHVAKKEPKDALVKEEQRENVEQKVVPVNEELKVLQDVKASVAQLVLVAHRDHRDQEESA